MYLDDVSVFSLITSRVGAIADQFTETQTDSLKGEIQTTGGVTAGVAKGEIKSKTEGTVTHSSQVLRKATVQATFKDLYELESSRLVIQPMATSVDPPKVRTVAEIIEGAGRTAFEGWVFSPGDWSRGAMAELRVELAADPIYKMSAAFDSFVELVKESPEMFPGLEDDLQEPLAINRLLQRMLVDLIPVRARALDYVAIENSGKVLLIHRKIADQIAGGGGAFQPLYIVGVTEQRLYWKDIRQVLYGNSTFNILCRVTDDSLKESWTPVKMVDVLGGVAPDLADAIREFGLLASGFLSGAYNAATNQEQLQSEHMIEALQKYSSLLVSASGSSLTVEAEAEIAAKAVSLGDSYASHESRRSAFEDIRNLVQRATATELDSSEAAKLRTAALVQAGFSIDGQFQAPPPKPLTPAEPLGRHMNVEMVAIYW
ncbi:DUF6414 family protein [Paractinoplanes brasiliensis]|uniref:DUF6414 family protein n=1 Tax=Paractinoplanes brasiliensis TaxID=52695 RepID=UPI00105B4F83|nr:hypothetical protein [Actinoplanes brasiliensis]